MGSLGSRKVEEERSGEPETSNLKHETVLEPGTLNINSVETWRERLALTRPYTIAYQTTSAAELFFVQLVAEDGTVGLGSAAPVEGITGETAEACGAALKDFGWLEGRDVRHLGRLTREAEAHLSPTPAARAAVDMALHDLFARHLGVPLVDVLGRCHDALPTSITIGIKSTEEALEEAEEYIGRGFRHIKVKLGHSLEEDVERLRKLREHVGADVRLRVDANQGYTVEETGQLGDLAEALDLELIEQPLPEADVEAMRSLPPDTRRTLAADESLHSEQDALRLASEPAACGIFNIKLMKCGGVTSGLAIARIAQVAGLDLMWGCMDESVISIAAALHSAHASPATRYLDLDGHLDLARDVATGGFTLRDGRLHLTDAPGLGVALSS